MKIFALLFTYFFLTASAFAVPLNRANDVVVKIESNQQKGSGTLIAFGGKTYALTSEHVVLHGNGENIQHFVINERIGRKKAKLIAADVYTGLALLEVPELGFDSRALVPSDLKTSEYAKKSRVSALGFPFRVNSLVESTLGEIANPRSDRGALPDAPWMLELSGTHAEYGMSGGPVFDSATGLLIGVLSQQYVRIIPGSPSEVVEFGPDSNTIENQIIAIPASIAKDWMREAVQPKYRPQMIREVSADHEKTVFLAYGVRMEIVGAKGSAAPIGGDGAGIGGRAGGDGTGIGGSEDQRAKQMKSPTARVILSADKKTAAWPSASASPWLMKARSILVGKKQLEISAFVKRGTDAGILEWINIRSAVHFVHLLGRTELSPVIVLPSDTGLVPAAVEQAAGKLSASLEKSKLNSSPSRLIAQIRAAADFAKTAEWAALSVAGLRAMENSTDWDALFSIDFDGAVSLLANLRALTDAIAKAQGI